MKRIPQFIVAASLLLTLNHQRSTAFAQGTAFTYQGQLQNNGSPASGTYNLMFTLFTTNSGGTAIAGPVTNNAVAVSNGLFIVTVDFGSSVWNGQTNWLEIGVETNNATSFTNLAPRQQVTPTPYAIAAESVDGTIPASQLTSIGNTNGGVSNFFVGPSGNATNSGYYNTANGVHALNDNASGNYNTANGFEVLYNNTSGSDNTADGAFSLLHNSSGYGNTADGFQALDLNVSGTNNTAAGAGALLSNTSGSDNTANGEQALYLNTSGIDNIGLGYLAGYNITTGSSNIDIGNPGVPGDTNIIRIGSGQTQTFIAGVINGNGGGLSNVAVNAAQLISIGNTNGGTDNFFVGPSGNTTTSGSDNTAIGASALNDNTTGSENTASGRTALYSNTSGSGNTADGWQALAFNGSGSDNTAGGYAALNDNSIGSENTADGSFALFHNLNGSDDTADGFDALFENTSGSNNIALGYFAGYNISTGSSNIDIGNEGLSTDTNIIRIGSGQTQTFIAGVINGDGGGLTDLSAAQLTSIGNNNGGDGNFFVGPSGNTTTSGSGNTADGVGALGSNTTGADNTAVGSSVLNNNVTGSYNAALGIGALYSNTKGNYNTACGENALYSNTNGDNNTAIGDEALFNNSSGFVNTAVGNQALYYNTNSENTAVGDEALIFSTSGFNNIALGYFAGYNIVGGSDNIDIGNEGTATDTNIIRIGSGQTATYLVGNVYTPSGTVETSSDRNAKDDFAPVNPQQVLARVASLPVTEWNYKTDRSAKHIGPMAQDFHAAFGLNGADDKHISVVDEGGVALAAVQGLNQKLEEQSAENTELRQENKLLTKRLDELEAEVKALTRNNH